MIDGSRTFGFELGGTFGQLIIMSPNNVFVDSGIPASLECQKPRSARLVGQFR